MTCDTEYVLVETILRPGATVAAGHVHPHQSETFQVLEGRVGMKVGRQKLELGAGDGICVLPGVPHQLWNAGQGQARLTREVRPAAVAA